MDRIEFRASLAASAIAEGLRVRRARHRARPAPAGPRSDPARAALPRGPRRDAEEEHLLRHLPHGQRRGIERRAPARALAGAVRTQDLVWGALGRFALPATGLIPPGILGHDAGRRQTHLPRETGRRDDPLRGAAAARPAAGRRFTRSCSNQYAALTEALFRIWADLGVEVEVVTKTMPEFLESWHANAGIDVMLGRWIADYDDPDNFTFTLFHSGNGALRAYFSSPETDRILEEARGEARPAAREALYRKFEHALLDSAILVPLFHDVDYRIAGPRRARPPASQHRPLRQLRRARKGGGGGGSAAPSSRRAAGSSTCRSRASSGASIRRSARPSSRARSSPSLFETLTRALDGTRIVPWLASEVLTENDGKRYRFRLRPGVRFHDGRRLTARDVRSLLRAAPR